MVCSAYFGEISEIGKKNWNDIGGNPYKILQSPICLKNKGHDLLDASAKYFSDEIKVDWGCYAWKCSSEQVVSFLKDYKSSLSWMQESEEKMIQSVRDYIETHGKTEYAVVFVEDC